MWVFDGLWYVCHGGQVYNCVETFLSKRLNRPLKICDIKNYVGTGGKVRAHHLKTTRT
jgi:hypothetical protein